MLLACFLETLAISLSLSDIVTCMLAGNEENNFFSLANSLKNRGFVFLLSACVTREFFFSSSRACWAKILNRTIFRLSVILFVVEFDLS